MPASGWSHKKPIMASPDNMTKEAAERGGGRGIEALRIDDTDLRLLNRLLLLVALVLLVVVGYRLWRIEHRRLALAAAPPSRAYQLAPVPAFEAESYYVQQVTGQNVFRTGSPAAAFPGGAEGVERTPEEVQKILQALKRDLVVVGVAWREPKLVMLYDKREKATYFLRLDQAVGKTGAKVRNISRNEVKIGLEDEEISLK